MKISSTAALTAMFSITPSTFSSKGRSLLRLPIEQRRELLEEALRKVQYPVLRSISFDAKPADLVRAAKELEIEGIIAKRKDRSTNPPSAAGLGSSTRSKSHKSS